MTKTIGPRGKRYSSKNTKNNKPLSQASIKVGKIHERSVTVLEERKFSMVLVQYVQRRKMKNRILHTMHNIQYRNPYQTMSKCLIEQTPITALAMKIFIMISACETSDKICLPNKKSAFYALGNPIS